MILYSSDFLLFILILWYYLLELSGPLFLLFLYHFFLSFLYYWDISSTANSHRLSFLSSAFELCLNGSSESALRRRNLYDMKVIIFSDYRSYRSGYHWRMDVNSYYSLRTSLHTFFSLFPSQQFNTLLVCSMRYLNCSVLKRKLLPFLKRYRVAPSRTHPLRAMALAPNVSWKVQTLNPSWLALFLSAVVLVFAAWEEFNYRAQSRSPRCLDLLMPSWHRLYGAYHIYDIIGVIWRMIS